MEWFNEFKFGAEVFTFEWSQPDTVYAPDAFAGSIGKTVVIAHGRHHDRGELLGAVVSEDGTRVCFTIRRTSAP